MPWDSLVYLRTGDMLRKIHPDKCGSAGLEATKRVNEAYDVLKDPDARAAYDLELDAQREQRV